MPGRPRSPTAAPTGAAAPLTTVGLRPPSVSGGQPPPDQRAASRLGILILNPYLELAYLAKYVDKKTAPDFAKIRADSRASADDREDGEYFKRQLLRARHGNPNIIFISGWNDWQYANHIEPAVEYGYQYVDMAASLLGRSAETAPYRAG